ncbi:hypothetical protein DFH09DRAFT_1394943 [Mycena vulgaris]|nr:hypothetical protein DFH09DRAFT_1394943 [Mycena vulgaris]
MIILGFITSPDLSIARPVHPRASKTRHIIAPPSPTPPSLAPTPAGGRNTVSVPAASSALLVFILAPSLLALLVSLAMHLLPHRLGGPFLASSSIPRPRPSAHRHHPEAIFGPALQKGPGDFAARTRAPDAVSFQTPTATANVSPSTTLRRSPAVPYTQQALALAMGLSRVAPRDGFPCDQYGVKRPKQAPNPVTVWQCILPFSPFSMSSELAPLAAADVAQAIALIEAVYAPAAATDAAQLQSLQSALLAMQRTSAAWGLVVPLLAHTDANVQFFGAHTVHAKIARGDAMALSSTDQLALRDALVGLAGVQRPRVVRRKLYGALTALALRLVPGTGWEGWVEGTVNALASAGAPSAQIHEFLAGAAEDVGAANLLPQPRIQLAESLRTAAPLVLQSVSAVLASAPTNPDPTALPAALTCLCAWLPSAVLPAPDVAALVPALLTLLASPNSTHAAAASSTMQELLARPPAAWRPSVLLEPLFLWTARTFPTPPAYDAPLDPAQRGSLRAHAKLLVALADAGVEWVAAHLVDTLPIASSGGTAPPRAEIAQAFLRVMLALTAADPGGAPMPSNSAQPDAEDLDEDEDDADADAGAPLGFWYLLQEALWEIPPAHAYLYASASASSSQASSSHSSTFPPSHSTSSSYSSAAGDPKTPPPSQEDYALMSDAEMGRGRGGTGGTPWTPAASASSSSAPQLAHAASFGFPGASSFLEMQDASAQERDGDRDGEGDEDGEDADGPPGAAGVARAAHAQGAYVALVRILRAKVVYPAPASHSPPGGGQAHETGHGHGHERGGGGWTRERLERFAVYRRDVGDTLVNAYYILRADLLAFYVADAEARLAEPRVGWEDLEATLHCLRAVHEALDPDDTVAGAALARVFAPAVWGRLPATHASGGSANQNGSNANGGSQEGIASGGAEGRVRRTALGLVETYASYFTTRPADAVLPPLQYVLGALADPDRAVCLQAALALRSLCDANRRALAGRIGAFAEVHAGLGGVPDSEKGKVLQSIASVIQALQPAEAVAPVEALVGPILERLGAALAAAGAHPEAARAAAILQLEILAGVAKGLTRTADPMAFDEDESGGAEADAVRAAREDPRTGALRGALFDAIARVAELWSADAEVGQALSELFKAITALPADVTLVSLPAQPLLGVVCRAAARRLTAVWLALAALLIAQLNPPPMILTLKSGPTEEAEAGVRGALGELVGTALAVLGAPNGMVENPDIVQEFFACMDRVAQDFTSAFCALPDGAFDALMQCAISALALQERYSLVAACTFLGTLIHRAALYAPLSPAQLQQLQAHMIRVHGRPIMRAVLCGFAGAAPRSVTPNLLELLGALVGRWDERAVAEAEGAAQGARGGQAQGGARGWVAGVVFADDFLPSRAGQADKERFVKTVVSSRSVKKTKEAANQFTLVAWGLEGSTFGYSSVSSV